MCFFYDFKINNLVLCLNLIVANLPYIADAEWHGLEENVRNYEPDMALRGGLDGLALIRSLLMQAAGQLAPGGAIFLEIGWQQGPAVSGIARDYYGWCVRG